jgi:plastocyanin
MPRKTTTMLATGLVAAMAVTAGCGSTSSNNDAANPTTETKATTAAAKAVTKAASQTIAVASPASGQLQFEPKALTAKAGVVKFVYDNKAQVPHNFVVLDQSGAPFEPTMPVFAAGTKSVTIELKAGTYKFICQPHEAAGMVGELKVS